MSRSKNKTVFVCQNCGAQRARLEGRCSDCGSWNSFVEESFGPAPDPGRGWALSSTDPAGDNQVITLDQPIEELRLARLHTGFKELDRVLGGGLVAGSFVLLGGDPGIGKSTLLLQMAGGLAHSGHSVLYVSAEESVNQTAMRAQRLGVHEGRVSIASESNLDAIVALARKLKPQLLVVDSIQTVYLPNLDSAPGSVAQVRECASRLMGLAKQHGISVFLIGHVTKEGALAGPKVLEHMVDTVLSFEGDMNLQFRLLRALKNRFGATSELGVFTMAQVGLAEVDNPSQLFLEERGARAIGSSVFASMEGSRPLLCEVQALTIPSPMAIPRRTSIGLDVGRVHLLVAALEKHAEIKLNQCDIFVNVVGGLKISEPAVDLAVAAALISTDAGLPVDPKCCLFGEIGLTGEIRAVSFAELRLREGDKLGFQQFVMPRSSRKPLESMSAELLSRITWVDHVQQLAEIFGFK